MPCFAVTKNTFKSVLAIAASVLFLSATTIAANGMPQQGKAKRKPVQRRAVTDSAKTRTCAVCDQVASLSQRVDELSRQLAESNKPVEDADARRRIAELEARLKSAEERAAAAEQLASSLRGEVKQTEQSVQAAETRVEKVSSALTETKTQVEKASAAVAQNEAAIKRLGPFRLSGDFRLRADAILRPAFPNPGPGQTALTHVQNVRARYRFRLNLDSDLNKQVSFHGQLATGPENNAVTMDQEFGATITRHPFFISEAWVDFHPTRWFSAQGGKVQEVFADNSRFLFDDDTRFNGFNEKFTYTFGEAKAGFRSVEFRAGQYILSNPNVAIVTAGNLGPTGAVIGSTGRGSQMFHQGLLVNQKLSEHASQQFGGDIQLYRNPNQIQFASLPAGLPIIVQNSLGLALSGPVTAAGTATTTSSGSIFTARNFQVARLTYRLDHAGFKRGDHDYPVSFNLQVARNLGTGQRERDGMLASLKLGNVRGRGDQSWLYIFSIKGANALISQLTDDDLGTGVGVNIRSHHIRYDIGLAKGVQLQNLLFIQNELRNSGQYPNFFVPLNAYTPRQYRIQEQIVFTF